MSDKELTPGRLIHLYVILKWDMFRDKPYPNGAVTAKEFVANANYDELNIVTKAEEYVNIVENAVNKLFGLNLKRDEIPTFKISREEESIAYDKIVKIASKLHDNWVENHPGRYKETSRRKHLPIELAGKGYFMQEMFFIAPFFKNSGLDLGSFSKETNKYGEFEIVFSPSEKLKAAYQKSVNDFKTLHSIKNAETLIDALIKLINRDYKALQRYDNLSTNLYKVNPQKDEDFANRKNEMMNEVGEIAEDIHEGNENFKGEEYGPQAIYERLY